MKPKVVRYYCPSCRQTVERTVTVARKLRKSYCERTGKMVNMRLRKSK